MTKPSSLTRIRRSALSPSVEALLDAVTVGSRLHLTIWGVPSYVTVTELSPTWVEFTACDPEKDHEPEQ